MTIKNYLQYFIHQMFMEITYEYLKMQPSASQEKFIFF